MSEGYLISSLIIAESRKFLIHWTGIELGKVAAPRALKVEFKMSKKKSSMKKFREPVGQKCL